MAKIPGPDKVAVTDNQLPVANKWTADDANVYRQSVNDLYDVVGAGATSDNLIVYSINTVGDLASVVAGITDAAVDNIYKIEIRPGAFTTEPVIMKPFIYINGLDKAACIFIADSVSDTIFTMVASSGIANLTLLTATSGIAVSFVATTGFSFSDNITVKDCDTGVYFDGGAAGALSVNDVSFAGTLTTGIDHRGGSLILRQPAVSEIATITTVVSSDSSDAVLTLDRPLTFSSNVGTFLSLTNGARASANDANIVGCADGVVVSGTNTNLVATGFKIFNCTNDGLRVDNTGTDISVSIFSSAIESATNLNINILNPSSTIIGNVFTDTTKVFAIDGAAVNFYILDDLDGDRGVKVIGELAVGTQLRPSEFIAGEGDSHAFLKCYSQISTGAFTDRTIAAKSASSSAFTFDDLLADSAIYVANDLKTSVGDYLKFHGIKASINTACVCTYGDMVTEYWNGSAWTEFNSSTQLADAPHWKYRKEYFDRTGNHHVKFNPAILSDWTENDPMSLGSTRHWMRFRLTNTITTAPIFQQFKVSTSRTEINPDGSKEGHGFGRNIKKLTLDSAGPIEGNMQSSDIYVDENVGVAYVKNVFTATSDIYGLSFELPEDCDTSIPIIIAWKGKFTAIGDPQFTIRYNIVSPGDPYVSSEPAASGNTKTVTSVIRTVAANVREDFSVEIDVSDAIPSRSGGFGDEIWLSIQNTTLAGNFHSAKWSANYGSDFDGRHLEQE